MTKILEFYIIAVRKQFKYFRFSDSYLQGEFQSLVYLRLFYSIYADLDNWIYPKPKSYLYSFCKYAYLTILKCKYNDIERLEKYKNNVIYPFCPVYWRKRNAQE